MFIAPIVTLGGSCCRGWHQTWRSWRRHWKGHKKNADQVSVLSY